MSAYGGVVRRLGRMRGFAWVGARVLSRLDLALRARASLARLFSLAPRRWRVLVDEEAEREAAQLPAKRLVDRRARM